MSNTALPETLAALTEVKIGDVINVGQFFWIPEDGLIGCDKDARHGHNSFEGGSVNTDCTLTVRAIKDGFAVVRLNRPTIPYGALAAIGTVFQIPLTQIAAWPAMIAAREEREKQRSKLARQFCR